MGGWLRRPATVAADGLDKEKVSSAALRTLEIADQGVEITRRSAIKEARGLGLRYVAVHLGVAASIDVFDQLTQMPATAVPAARAGTIRWSGWGGGRLPADGTGKPRLISVSAVSPAFTDS